jgi:hypothetical protein
LLDLKGKKELLEKMELMGEMVLMVYQVKIQSGMITQRISGVVLMVVMDSGNFYLLHRIFYTLSPIICSTEVLREIVETRVLVESLDTYLIRLLMQLVHEDCPETEDLKD